MITAMKEYDYGDRDPLTAKIVSARYSVHTELGPGFKDRIYSNTLKAGLIKIGLDFTSEKEFGVRFQERIIGKFRVDLLVENKIIVEIKAVEGKIPKIFETKLFLI